MIASNVDTQASQLRALADEVLGKALKAGATDAEAVVYEGEEFSALVRLGQVETLQESGSRAVGLRVFLGQRVANTSSSEFSAESIERLVSGAIELAKVTSEDPFAGLPEAGEFAEVGGLAAAQHLYFDDVNEMPAAERIETARRGRGGGDGGRHAHTELEGRRLRHGGLAQDHGELARLRGRVPAAATAASLPHRSRSMGMAPCRAATGTRAAGRRACSSHRRRLDASPHSALSGGWARGG